MANATQVDEWDPSPSLRAVRSQAAIVRALLDELERIDEQLSDGMSEQVIEELARLACRMLETASQSRR